MMSVIDSNDFNPSTINWENDAYHHEGTDADFY